MDARSEVTASVDMLRAAASVAASRLADTKTTPSGVILSSGRGAGAVKAE
jgi:hypothetical protein